MAATWQYSTEGRVTSLSLAYTPKVRCCTALRRNSSKSLAIPGFLGIPREYSQNPSRTKCEMWDTAALRVRPHLPQGGCLPSGRVSAESIQTCPREVFPYVSSRQVGAGPVGIEP